MSDIDESQRQASELMSSIERRLVTLFEPSSKLELAVEQSPQKELHPPSSILKTTEKMKIDELECSEVKPFPVRSPAQTGKKQHSSGVLQQINKMEEFYMNKIRDLDLKVNRLQMRNQQLEENVAHLSEALQKSQEEVKKLSMANQQEIDRTVSELSRKMMARLADQTTEICMTTEAEKERLRKQLNTATQRIVELERYTDLLKQEKDNLEAFYYNLVDNHRRLLKADIERNKASLTRSESSVEKASPLKNSRLDEQKERLQSELERIRKSNKELKRSRNKVRKELPSVVSEVKILKNKLRAV